MSIEAPKVPAKVRCRSCGMSYSPKRPMCTDGLCAEFRATTSPVNIGLCICCCFSQTRKLRPKHGTQEAGFICYSCGRIIASVCTCCDLSFLCTNCCEEYNHRFCCKNKIIEFVQPALRFGHPSSVEESIDKDLGVRWLSRDQSMQILSRTYPVTYLDPKGFTINSSRRYASTEIEIFTYEDATQLNKAIDKWRCAVVQDRSMVREALARGLQVDRDKSFEINTTPVCGNLLQTQLLDIGEGLDKAKAQVTIDCGVHVHVDCRDYGYQDLRKLIKVYYFVEEALFAAVHWTRKANTFCKPIGADYYDSVIASNIKPTTKDLKAAIITSVYGKDSLDTRSSPYRATRQPNFWYERSDHYGRGARQQRNEKRYSALNLHSYFLRGSIESRIHHGSTDVREIYDWAKLLVDLFDEIVRIPESVLDKLLDVSPVDMEMTKDYLQLEDSTRTNLDRSKIVTGVTILGFLLPRPSFNVLLDKIETNYKDKLISSKKVLPCQRGKTTLEPVEGSKPERAVPIDRDQIAMDQINDLFRVMRPRR